MKILTQFLTGFGVKTVIAGAGMLSLLGCGEPETRRSHSLPASSHARSSVFHQQNNDDAGRKQRRRETLDAEIALLNQRNKELTGAIKLTLESSQHAMSMVGMEAFQNAFDRAASEGQSYAPRSSAREWMQETSRDLDRLLAEQSSLGFKLRQLEAERAALR